MSACGPACVRACIHASVRAFVQACVHACLCACVRASVETSALCVCVPTVCVQVWLCVQNSENIIRETLFSACITNM